MHQLDNTAVKKINTSICAQGLNENEIEGTNENREMEIIKRTNIGYTVTLNPKAQNLLLF